MVFSSQEDVEVALKTVCVTFQSGKTKSKDWRKQQLQRTWWMLEDNKDRICAALYEDLHKHQHEALSSDCAAIQSDVLHTLKCLDEWTRDERPARTNPLNFLGKATVRKEPLGVVLIIGAWNYPFILLLQPMIAAIAAGCCIILKPSEVAVASESLIMEMIPRYLDQEAIQCITAGAQEMGFVLTHRFDHIFYTGSSTVAKIIASAAAKNLTPVTLELGGQGPAIVCKSANIDLTAKRIAATKFLNAGQICLNVNHVLVEPSVRARLVECLIKHFNDFLGGKGERPSYYSHIINDRNFDRLDKILNNTSGKVVYGGHRDRPSRYFAPTIVVDVSPTDSLLAEELFGPVLPIIDADLSTAMTITRGREHPLAIYGFTESQQDKDTILAGTMSGGVTFNDCILHVAAQDAPFGGVGHSGMGYYHGRYGVLAFSHLRTFIDPPTWMDKMMAARYPPYTLEKSRQISPEVKPPFDREGNTARQYGPLSKLGVMALMIGSAGGLWLYRNGWLDAIILV